MTHLLPLYLAEASVELYFLLIVLGVAAIIFLAIVGKFISLWFQAFVSGTPIPFFNIIGMSLRKIPPRIIVTAAISATKAGLKISVNGLETHYLAGGRVIEVVQAMIVADKANIPLDWRQATAIDLAGRDILDAVRTSVNPKVIDCPDKGQADYVAAVAKNGVQLLCRARITVRTNIQQLVGGATEETIIARVGEGIVNAIGSSETHLEVLGNPQRISSLVLSKGLDSQTAFQVIDVSIAKLDVGENIGAKLRAEQAEGDKRIFQAEAEKRRAMAVAQEQEMKANLVKAEAEVPLAIAHAFEKGHIGIMDYYRLKNIQADTQMRDSLSHPEEPPKNKPLA